MRHDADTLTRGSLTNLWWRHTEYCFDREWIRPAANARLTAYDPWATPEGEQGFQSILGLANVLHRYGHDDEKFPRLVLDWCNEHGLLGLLPHQTIQAFLAPRWRPYGESLLAEVETHYRASNGWVSASAAVGKSRFSRRMAPAGLEGTLCEEVDLASGEFSSCVIYRELPWDYSKQYTVRIRSLGDVWGAYFPDVPEPEKNSFEYPRPTSDDFWSMYGEPWDRFVRALAIFRDAFETYREHPETTLRSPQALAHPYSVHRENMLSELAGPIGLGLDRTKDGQRLQWRAPSLLSLLAIQALFALDDPEVAVRSCSICGVNFPTSKKNQEYCSVRCRHTGQKRQQRRRIRAKSSLRKGESS